MNSERIELSPEQLHVLQHSLGLDQYGQGAAYRNRFVTDPEGKDGQVCLELCRLELMADAGPQAMCGGMHCFFVTEMGKMAVRVQSPRPPRLTRSQERYRRFLDSDTGLSFREWLSTKWAKA